MKTVLFIGGQKDGTTMNIGDSQCAVDLLEIPPILKWSRIIDVPQNEIFDSYKKITYGISDYEYFTLPGSLLKIYFAVHPDYYSIGGYEGVYGLQAAKLKAMIRFCTGELDRVYKKASKMRIEDLFKICKNHLENKISDNIL